MKDTEQRLKFIRLRAQGQSLSTIASQLGVARQTLANWEDALEEEVQNMKAMELDALREAYFMTKKARIEDIATMRQRIREELERRDFADVPTAKLVQLDLANQAKLEAEFADVRVKGELRLTYEKERKADDAYRMVFTPSSSPVPAPPLLLDYDERDNGKRRRDMRDAH